MRTSELIAQLQAVLAEHGDLPVFAVDDQDPDHSKPATLALFCPAADATSGQDCAVVWYG